MALIENKSPAERNKLVAAIGLGAIAVLVLAYNFGLFSGGKRAATNSNTRRTARTGGTTRAGSGGNVSNNASREADEIQVLRPVVYSPSTEELPIAGRNIFAHYVAPIVTRSPGTGTSTALATPTPPPPILVTSATTPAGGLYAGTGGFKLEVSGDKFTPQTRVYIDNQEVETQFVSAQQLRANVPASLIASAGARQVMVRTPDGQLYSNSATLNVMQPPKPPYTYVGLLGTQRYSDKAILKDQKGDLVNVQLGDLIGGGRFRVTVISERAVEVIDQELKIKHALPYTESARPASPAFSMQDNRPAAPQRYTPPPPPPQPPAKAEEEDDDDDEP